MWYQKWMIVLSVLLFAIPVLTTELTTDSSTVTTSEKTTTARSSSATTPEETQTTKIEITEPSTTSQPSSSSLPSTSSSTSTTTVVPESTTELSSTTTTTTIPTTSPTSKPTTTSTAPPQYSTEWEDIEEEESQKLVNFVVSEIQKLKVEHRELDECQELDLSSVLSGKKLNGKIVKYSITLKVQPQVKNTEDCLKQNGTLNNMHPEICEADVSVDDREGTDGKTLLRSTCLQVEELLD